MPKARKLQISLEATPYYHIICRCVRRAFLCGQDQFTGRSCEAKRPGTQWSVVELSYLDAQYNALSTDISQVATSGVYIEHSLQNIAPPNAVYAAALLYSEDQTLVDNCGLYKVGEPTLEAEPVVETEQVVEAEPLVEAEPVVEPEPVVEAEPVVAEPIVEVEPIVESEPVVEPVTETVIFNSISSEDGWVLEQSENASVGNRINNVGGGSGSLRFGDNGADRQYKSIISFDTSALPVNAVITDVRLELTRGVTRGVNAFDSHGNALIEMKKGYFGTSKDLESSDFESEADLVASAFIENQGERNTRYAINLDDEGGFINPTGHTQFRLSFTQDDNDNRGNDWVGFYSARNVNSSRHPALVIEYTLQ